MAQAETGGEKPGLFIRWTAPDSAGPGRRLSDRTESFFGWVRLGAEALAKLDEELQELKQALRAGEQKAIDREMGDLLFAAANVSRRAGVNPETALLLANRRFRERFAYMESRLREQGRDPAQASLPEMDALWEEAKDRGVGG
jgi:uncharacterized protein YabN with tetrapyrrole methylase and pyrophosphatase domain